MTLGLVLLLGLAGGLDFGGHVAGVWPTGGLSRFHSSAAMVGATCGWSQGRFRVSANYDYTSLPGRAAPPYRTILHLGRAEIGFALLDRPSWSFGLLAGGGPAYGIRQFGLGDESGTVGSAHWGLGLTQRTGPSRVSISFIHSMFWAAAGERGPGPDHLLSLRAGVGYAP